MPSLRGHFVALAIACLIPAEGVAQITWYWDGPARTPQEVLDQITASMDEAVDHYNAYSVYDWQEYSNDPRGIRVIYDPLVPTANAGYRSRISFGNSRGPRTAMHEMGHVFGVGTFYPTWPTFISDGKWQGTAANTEYQLYEGPGAQVNAGPAHFWNYGLNFASGDSPEARFRHVRVIGALREDMGLRNGNATALIGDYNNDGVTDARDYTVYRDRLGDTASLLNDRTIGGVDRSDYSWWRRGYGGTVGAANSAVPEPGTLVLTLLATLPAWRRGRR